MNIFYETKFILIPQPSQSSIGCLAPIAITTIVCIVLSILASYGWSLRQMDVKNGFLHDGLTRNICMTPPLGLSSTSKGVCKFKHSLYDLKQTLEHGMRNCIPLYSSSLFRVSMIPLYLFITHL